MLVENSVPEHIFGNQCSSEREREREICLIDGLCDIEFGLDKGRRLYWCMHRINYMRNAIAYSDHIWVLRG